MTQIPEVLLTVLTLFLTYPLLFLFSVVVSISSSGLSVVLSLELTSDNLESQEGVNDHLQILECIPTVDHALDWLVGVLRYFYLWKGIMEGLTVLGVRLWVLQR